MKNYIIAVCFVWCFPLSAGVTIEVNQVSKIDRLSETSVGFLFEASQKGQYGIFAGYSVASNRYQPTLPKVSGYFFKLLQRRHLTEEIIFDTAIKPGFLSYISGEQKASSFDLDLEFSLGYFFQIEGSSVEAFVKPGMGTSLSFAYGDKELARSVNSGNVYPFLGLGFTF